MVTGTSQHPASRKQREKDFHNKGFAEHTRQGRAGRFYSVVEASGREYRQTLEQLCANGEALEYGCGPGSYAFFMADRQAAVTGIDISEVAIRQAKRRSAERGAAARFAVMDAENLAFADGAFDLVCGRAILHHLDLQASLSELTRVLRANGHGVFQEPLAHNPLIALFRKLTPGLRTADEHPLRTTDLRLIQQYFTCVRFRYFHCLSLAASLLAGLPGQRLVLRCLEAIDQFLFRVFPALGKYAWTVVIEASGPRKACHRRAGN